MTPQLALFASVIYVAWLFFQNGKQRSGCSRALWLPVIWLVILGSKSPATWLADLTHSARDTEGSSLDTLTFMVLLAAGVRVLARRNVSWRAVMASNKWIFLFF